MGQRANLIIVQNGKYSLYYSHWCANTIPRDLFWGPNYAIDFVRIQRKLDESDWLDDVWAEGAAVIDCDRRVLLFYGGEDVLYDVPLRRVYLQMLQRVWAPWEIRWAHEGIAEIADFVGYPRSNVLSQTEQVTAHYLVPPEQREWTDIVGSFVLCDGTRRLYPLAGDVECYLLAGPGLTEQCADWSREESIPLDEWIKDSFPTGGFHIDLLAKSVDYWTAKDIPGVPNLVSASWPGWTVNWHRDNYEFQLDAAAGKLRFPTRFKDLLQAQLKEMLLREYRRSPVATVVEITDRDCKDGKDVRVNPWALRDDRLELDRDQRQRIVARALDDEKGS